MYWIYSRPRIITNLKTHNGRAMPINFARYQTYLMLFILLALSACQTKMVKTSNSNDVNKEPRWFNSQIFDDVGTTPYDLEFEIEYYAADNSVFTVKSCTDINVIGEGKIAEREFTRWQALKADCEAVARFYQAPESALSYWPESFDFSLLKTLPATAVPYLGGQGLDNRSGNLSNAEPTITLLQQGEHNIKVSLNSTVVNYVVVARGDFNRDGYQDLFVRMDWYVKDAFGDGHDWVVFTKLSPNTAPIMLWRK